ncbi:MAG: hypothetical protein ACYS1A_05025 [Planctomycetota bacterium]
MNEADKNEQLDDDILQCRKDILRASDIIPSYNAQQAKSNRDNTPKTQGESIKPGDDESAKEKDTEQKRGQIPRFDLAEEIMAEQRKITAIKRKAPDKKTGLKAEPIRYAIEPQRLMFSEQEGIIAEIVARDIERLCRGGSVGR